MLIYNYQKEFVGIDESDLKTLGFSDLSQLRNESDDFADLFVKTPGFVHNFKHVHWIDFVTCAEGSDDSKVVIHANGKNFRCVLDIKTAYLVDNPTKKAYIINLSNLRTLTHSENEQIAGDILEKPAHIASAQSNVVFNTPEFTDEFNAEEEDKTIVQNQEPQESVEVTHDPYEISTTDTLDELGSNPQIIEDIYEDSPIDLYDEPLEVGETEAYESEDENIHIEPEEQPEEQIVTPVAAQVLNTQRDYVYDPHLASDELGLPVDLIEEFIQDFINQAKDFKDDLYQSLLDGNMDNVKILSHKLKGVAANLRIEDAFEVLTNINTSSDTNEIKTNMDTFYLIIEKLSGKNIQEGEIAESQEEISMETEIEEIPEDKNDHDDDDLILSFKDDDEVNTQEKIEDIEVPQKIEMPELADDDFLNNDITENYTPELELEEITLDNEIGDLNEIDIDFESTQDDTFLNDSIEIEELDTLEETATELSQSTFSKAMAASEIGIDSQSFDALFDDFIIEARNDCTKINEAVQQDDAQTWKETAVKLKSMSDNMRIHDFTKELESIINTQDADLVKESIDLISAKLEQISGKEV
ncbi:Hpt domain-containing protein [Sulfurimonas sp.]|uniref:Hpt domain-containing protein n=1 Tax=Sulfurimonas sp. TaxID=2022749 RepID=UPI003565232A